MFPVMCWNKGSCLENTFFQGEGTLNDIKGNKEGADKSAVQPVQSSGNCEALQLKTPI